MAKLDKLPSQEIIDGFKGVLDFYLWMGIPVCRAWPIYRPHEPSAAERAAQERFSYINKLATTVDPLIRQAFVDMAIGTSFTWKDLYVKAYLSGPDIHVD